MRTDTATGADRKIRLADYRPPAWMIEQVRLDFDLAPRATRVRARIAFRRNSQAEGARPVAFRCPELPNEKHYRGTHR